MFSEQISCVIYPGDRSSWLNLKNRVPDRNFFSHFCVVIRSVTVVRDCEREASRTRLIGRSLKTKKWQIICVLIVCVDLELAFVCFTHVLLLANIVVAQVDFCMTNFYCYFITRCRKAFIFTTPLTSNILFFRAKHRFEITVIYLYYWWNKRVQLLLFM